MEAISVLSAYPACFFKEPNGYSVLFPDLDKATCGNTLDKAFLMAMDCLAGLLYEFRKDGKETPPPSRTDEIDLDKALAELYEDEKPVVREAFVSLVVVDVEEYARHHFEKMVKSG